MLDMINGLKCPYCNGKTSYKYYKGLHALKCPAHFLIVEESLEDLYTRYEALKREIEKFRKNRKRVNNGTTKGYTLRD